MTVQPIHGRLDMLIAAQANICAGCGKPMLPRQHRNQIRSAIRDDLPSTDHVIPRARHGKEGLGNVVAMHKLCNEVKADDMPTGCELIWLMAVNARIGVGPVKW